MSWNEVWTRQCPHQKACFELLQVANRDLHFVKPFFHLDFKGQDLWSFAPEKTHLNLENRVGVEELASHVYQEVARLLQTRKMSTAQRKN